MTDREQLAQLGFRLAQRLDDRGLLEAGIVRQLARAVLETADRAPAADDACPGCGTPIVQKPTGRPRTWCSDRCRKGRTKPAETSQWGRGERHDDDSDPGHPTSAPGREPGDADAA